jgi:hypothetical protein
LNDYPVCCPLVSSPLEFVSRVKYALGLAYACLQSVDLLIISENADLGIG